MAKSATKKYKLYANLFIDTNMRVAMEYQDLLQHSEPKIRAVLQQGAVFKFGQLRDGVDRNNLKGTEMMHFITSNKIPFNKKANL